MHESCVIVYTKTIFGVMTVLIPGTLCSGKLKKTTEIPIN